MNNIKITNIEPQSINVTNTKNINIMGGSDYNKLKNKPTINGNKLIGNLTTEELGILKDVKFYIDENKEDLKGDPGVNGYTPIKGIDYWTENDKKEIESYIDELINGEITQALGSDY